MLNRNVGHLMTNPSILLKDGSEIPEGMMDALYPLYAQFMILRIIKIQGLVLFILLNLKCTDLKKSNLLMLYLQSRTSSGYKKIFN